jgi:opacity protein-like surface antigen
MKNLKSFSPSILCLCFATGAGLLSPSTFAQSTGAGPYVGVGINASATSVEKNAVPGTSSDRNGYGARLNAGYQITPNYGLEAGWSNLRSFSETFKIATGNTSQKYQVKTTYLAATGRWGVSENVSLVAKAGIGSNKVSGTNVLATSDNLIGKKTSLYTSAGVAYKLTPSTAITLDYEVAGKRTNKVNAHALTLGLQYSF